MFKRLLVFIIKLLAKMKDDNIAALSAQFSFYIILGIFPFLILAISILCGYSNYIFYLLDSVEAVLPEDVFQIVYGIVHNSVGNCSRTYFSSSLLISLWSATAGSATIISGINRAYGFNIKNNYLFMRIEGIIFTIAIMLAMHLIFASIVWGSEIILFIQKINLFQATDFFLVHVLRYALPFLILLLIFSAAYKFLTYEKVSLSYVIPGAVFSSCGFIVGSAVYSNYISTKAMYYSSIYGNLSGVIIFLIWIFILSLIFLTGAEINYFTGKRTIRK